MSAGTRSNALNAEFFGTGSGLDNGWRLRDKVFGVFPARYLVNHWLVLSSSTKPIVQQAKIPAALEVTCLGVRNLRRKAINPRVDSDFCAGPRQAPALRRAVGKIRQVPKAYG